MAKVNRTINIENARLMFRNFSGREGKFNKEGVRSFAVLLDDPDLVRELEEEGWNVKYLNPREEGDKPQPYLNVSVTYGDFPPKVYLVTRKKKTLMTVETIGSLDYAEIDTVDLIIRPYNWEVRGDSGVKAYLKTMYVTVVEDDFAEKYADLDDNDSQY